MAEIHHFTYGWFTPVAALLLAFLGSLLGLACAARARTGRNRPRRTRWLVIAAVAIGGAGIWLMHFVAMLGFEVPRSPLRYDPALTLASMALAVVPMVFGVLMVGRGPVGAPRLLGAGLLTGAGLQAMHYAGALGLRVAGEIIFDPPLAAAAALVAAVAATVALWCTARAGGWARTTTAAAVMALAFCGMHYAGMASLRVRLSPEPVEVTGLSPFLLIIPVTLISAGALIAMAFTGLQAMTEEEFDGATIGRHRDRARAVPVRSEEIGPVRHEWALVQDRMLPRRLDSEAPAA